MDILVPALALVIGAAVLFLRRFKNNKSESGGCGGCSGCSGAGPASVPRVQTVQLKKK